MEGKEARIWLRPAIYWPHMRRRILILSLVILPLALLAVEAARTAHAVDTTRSKATSKPPAKTPPKSSEAYDVYSAALPFGYHSPGRTVAIRSKTVPVPDLQYAAGSVQQEFAGLQVDPVIGPAIQQMMAAPGNEALQRQFQISDKYELLDSDMLDGMLHQNDTPLGRKEGWRKFSQTYSEVDGLTEVSAVGFNRDHTIAVFYAMHRAGTGCNDEGFEVLEKQKGHWTRLTEKGFSFAACY